MSYVGWDWASRTHDVTVLDNDGRLRDRWAFEHTESGWTSTLHRLRRYGQPHELPVIIERTSGLVVDRLLGAGHAVVPVHPASFFAARPPMGSLWREIRSRGQLQAGRLPAHRRAPAAPARAHRTWAARVAGFGPASR